jgi:spermidine synthase
MAFDLVVIFAFQTLYGYVYQQIGLLFTAFMIGLSLGGWWMSRWLGRNAGESGQPIVLHSALLKLEAAIVVYLTVFPLALVFLHSRAPEPAEFAWVRPVLLGLNGVAGMLVGLEFPLANALYLAAPSRVRETAGMLYAADLVGACLGALAVSVALLPALGILETCALLVVLKLGSLILVATMSSRHRAPMT